MAGPRPSSQGSQELQRQMAETMTGIDRRLRKIEALEFLFGEAAAMLLCCGGANSQVIPDNAWTELDFNFASGGTWEMGLVIEDGHVPLGDGIDKVRVTTIPPGQSIMFFTIEVGWDDLSVVGKRGVRWLADDGSAAVFYGPITNDGDCSYSAHHWRRQTAPAAYYHLQVYQDSGGPLNLGFLNFGIWRLR